jgi:hypothetical protein
LGTNTVACTATAGNAAICNFVTSGPSMRP